MIKILKNLGKLKGTAAAALFFVVLEQLVALALPLMMSLIINNGISTEDMQYVKQVGLAMIAVSVLGVGVAVVASYYSSKTSMLFGKIIRENIFLKVETLSMSDIDIIGTPSLITRSTSDIKVLQDFVLQSLKMIISAPVMLVGGTIMAFFMNAKMALIMFAVLPLIALIAWIVFKLVVPLFKKRQLLTDEVNRFLRQKLSGIRVIRAFNTTEYEDDRFTVLNNKLSAFILKFSRIMSTLIPTCITLVAVVLAILIYVSCRSIDTLTDVVKIQNSVGDLIAFVVYMVMVIAAISITAAMFVIVPRANISAKRINEIMAVEPKITDPETPETIAEDEKGTVEFRNVSFSYGGEEAGRKVLSDVSFIAEAGKTTAIIGATGSGKTTLITLISRFYDVDEGQILFGGHDVRNLAQSDLHSRIAFVPQRGMLFSGSIKDNLLYGDENASDGELLKALEISQATEFVSELPDGMDSFVTQNATNYSGGQKQRLSIARALVRKADVYLFDDSFSALDFRTDAKLRHAIRENVRATVIIVAQRVGTIMEADKIIVLDEGRIVGQGTHRELYETCEVYREIALSQLSEEEVKAHG